MNNYRNISVLPTASDFSNRNQTHTLQANIPKGRFDGVVHYLNIHCNLLREDYIRQLREGIAEYKCSTRSNQKRLHKAGDVNIYFNIRIIDRVFETNGLYYEAEFDVTPFRNHHWESSKQLLPGSLICLTTNKFQTFRVATIAGGRDFNNLTNGKFYLQFEDTNSNCLDNCDEYTDIVYTMAESPVYFEAYRHNLELLKTFDASNFPFKEYIIDINKQIACVNYQTFNKSEMLKKPLKKITENEIDSWQQTYKGCDKAYIDENDFIREQLKKIAKEYYKFSPYLVNKISSFGLNESQYKAFEAALSQSFTIIQGPPGTGKTHVGLRIVQALLQNQYSKIHLICLTNHALDQFLQGILPFCHHVIRIGGNSQNKLVNAFNLNSIRKQMRGERKIPSDIYRNRVKAYNNLKTIINEITELEMISTTLFMVPLEMEFKEITREFIQRYNKNFKIPCVAKWLGYKPVICSSRNEEKKYQHGNNSYTTEISFILDQRMVDDYDNNFTRRKLNQMPSEYIRVGMNNEHIIYYFEKDLENVPPMSEKEAICCIKDGKIEGKNRLRFYKFWLPRLQENFRSKFSNLYIRYNSCLTAFRNAQMRENEYIVAQSRIIAMTTTGAAKYRHLIDAIQPDILVVEEAAEVLEAHIITSLCKGSRKLILIGDHQQLRPKLAVNELGQRFHFDISLFERMVNNELPFYQLNEQHRMHPNISSLLVPHIYKDLRDAPSVFQYEKIKGMPSNVFFLNHKNKEQNLDDSTSRKNFFEASSVIKFAQYLMRQGYKSSQITILTTYSAQLAEINRQLQMRANQDAKKVGVFVVDNYQGEENDIIIISFVRSNRENNIGFLKTENRVNVALSRAKMAMYCVGNFDSFCRNSPLWRAIIQKTKDLKAFSNTLEVSCPYHSEPKFVIQQPNDFDKIMAKPCAQPCNTILKCFHICVQRCHTEDREHNTFKCNEKCNKMCPGGHMCRKKCHYYSDCEICRKFVVVDGECGHKINIICGHSRNKSQVSAACASQCEKTCSKGHRCEKKCHYGIEYCGLCETVIQVIGKCGNTVNIKCVYSNNNEVVRWSCMSPCGETLQCGHVCKGSCRICIPSPFHAKCFEQCERTLFCGHLCAGTCNDSCNSCRDASCTNTQLLGTKAELDNVCKRLRRYRNYIDNATISASIKQLLTQMFEKDRNEFLIRGIYSKLEIQRRNTILDYWDELKSTMKKSFRVTKYQVQLESLVSVPKLSKRLENTLVFLSNFKNVNDKQSIYDLNLEIKMLKAVFGALNRVTKHYFDTLILPSSKIDAHVVVKLRPIFDLIPEAEPCSADISTNFSKQFDEVFEQISSWRCVIS